MTAVTATERRELSMQCFLADPPEEFGRVCGFALLLYARCTADELPRRTARFQGRPMTMTDPIRPQSSDPSVDPSGIGSATLEAVTFDARGLVPAVAQQYDTGEVLMVAWMNAASLAETLATGRVTYWSRSRGELWRKGDTSGHVQRLVDLRVDCDGDTLLVLVDQTGPACHTGRRSCFYRKLENPSSDAAAGSPGPTVGQPTAGGER